MVVTRLTPIRVSGSAPTENRRRRETGGEGERVAVPWPRPAVAGTPVGPMTDVWLQQQGGSRMTAVGLDDVVRHAGEDDLPWVDATGGVWLKVLRVDAANGIWVVRNRFEPGARLQRHRHTGPVDGYTVSGRWHYLEYDFFSTAGSYIREPAGSVHTLDVPADNDSVTEVLFVMEGVNLNLADDGSVESVFDGPGTLAAYEALAVDQGFDRPTGVIVD